MTATRGDDATTATVSWTKYTGGDFDYYRFVVCPDSGFIEGSCSNNVFTSDAYYDAGSTGPVTVTGLDAQAGYGVILQVWRTGGKGALKPNTTIPAAPAAQPRAANVDLSFNGATIADQSYIKDEAITTLDLPQATGGGGTITYGLSPSLPTGLSFDASARTITGTPTATSVQATYRYTATDGTDTVMLSFSIEVLEKAAIGCSSLKSSISVSASTNPSHSHICPCPVDKLRQRQRGPGENRMEEEERQHLVR